MTTPTATMRPAMFKCPCGQTFRRDVEAVGSNYRNPLRGGVDARPVAQCPCGKWRYGRAIVGRLKPNVACGGICRSAKGPTCDCSCGGANHGANHS